jgi:serine/threonine protein kinase
MDEYLISGFLGRGGFGRVYLARQLPILLKAALKVLNFDSIPESGRQKITEKFEIEAKALASLSHPNVVRLLKYGISKERPYLVMELVTGGRNLKNAVYDRIQRGDKVSKKGLFHILHQVVNALDAAHRNPSEPIVHRDVKPENIMLHSVPEDPNFVKVLDFGLAKFIAGDAETTSIMGTPVYMAPEQLTRSDIGPWTDLYSLGVITFELCTGRCPFQGDTHSEVIAHKVDPDFDPVEILDQPNIPEEAKSFYRKALARHPKDRFHNAEEFRSGLRALEACLVESEDGERENSRAPAKLFKSSIGEEATSDTIADASRSFRDPDLAQSTPMGVPSFMAQDKEKIARVWLPGLIGALAAVLVIFFWNGDDTKVPTTAITHTSSLQEASGNRSWSGLAGSDIWKAGNKWNLRVVRVASIERVDEGAPLEFLIRREIERVEKDDDGDLRVEVRETGGLLKPRLRVFEVNEHCITDLNNSSRKWCVDDLSRDLKTVAVLGGSTQAFEEQADSFSLQFSPEMGWIREVQVQSGTGRKTTRRLRGVLLDGKGFGKINQIPMPCSWDRFLGSGELMGHADAEGSPEAQKALEAGLEGPIYAYNIKLSGQYGFERLRALRDETSTIFELIGTHEVEILKPDLQKYRLQQVKAWVNTKEPAEYAVLKLKGDRNSAVIVVRMAVDGISAEIFRIGHARSHHSIALIAYGEACQFQIQRVKSGSRKVKRYTFGAERLEEKSGSLKVRSALLKLQPYEVNQ